MVERFIIWFLICICSPSVSSLSSSSIRKNIRATDRLMDSEIDHIPQASGYGFGYGGHGFGGHGHGNLAGGAGHYGHHGKVGSKYAISVIVRRDFISNHWTQAIMANMAVVKLTTLVITTSITSIISVMLEKVEKLLTTGKSGKHLRPLYNWGDVCSAGHKKLHHGHYHG